MQLGSRVAVAVAMVQASGSAPVGPVAWEPPYATGAAPPHKKERCQNSWYTDHTESGLLKPPSPTPVTEITSVPRSFRYICLMSV